MIGWEKRTLEPGVGLPTGGLVIPPATGIKDGWVTLAEWSVEDAEALDLIGPSTLYRHVGGLLGDPKAPGEVALTYPREIITQWVRPGGDLTQREGHIVGEARRWAAGASGPEKLSLDDFPLKVQIWQRGGVLVVEKVTSVIDSPDARLAALIAP